jgi:hypothetical protein
VTHRVAVGEKKQKIGFLEDKGMKTALVQK